MARLFGTVFLAIGSLLVLGAVISHLVDKPAPMQPEMFSSLLDGLCFVILGSVLLALNWLFQRRRLSDRRPCPNDALLIPNVGEACDGAEPVRFFWCWSCMELFALVGNASAGRWAASFAYDVEAGGWKLWKATGSERDV